ncbi:hypothetical protein BJ684DRAFT_19194 [Piptocephalis cylindrospora]|uniref:Cullin family profile domain-containing protein n=1 Tax=Piptocephalis cylindrospora TaxID=1907219 RepID=A0A4P9Y8T9_9FUNG|nr:hypothetical protein BJ684DRAFT_19194 [Piptocephalis cylindrospora]|eukprot:RKP14400.1 hypothetical protein BJ684DRAFT_19194 [Piptocephalis cylindrospora]
MSDKLVPIPTWPGKSSSMNQSSIFGLFFFDMTVSKAVEGPTRSSDDWKDWYPRYQRALRAFRKARNSSGPVRPITLPACLQRQFVEYWCFQYQTTITENAQAISKLSPGQETGDQPMGVSLNPILSSMVHAYCTTQEESQLVDTSEKMNRQIKGRMIESHRRIFSGRLDFFLSDILSQSFHAFHTLGCLDAQDYLEDAFEIVGSIGTTSITNQKDEATALDILRLTEEAIHATQTSARKGCTLVDSLTSAILTVKHLQALGLGIDVEIMVKKTILQEVEACVDRVSRSPSSLRHSVISSLESWCDHFFGRWKRLVFYQQHGTDGEEEKNKAPVCMEAKSFLHDCMGYSRARQITAIIKDYPASRHALEDLRECIERPRVMGVLRERYIDDTKKYLFRPGTQTSVILHCYIITIRIMRYLDSSGVLLEMASKPLRAYLKLRPDTIRCIVAALLDTKTYPELHEELRKGQVLREDMIDLHHAPWNSEDWTPDPIEADPKLAVLRLKTTDTVTALISLFPEMTGYTIEIQEIMAQRLLRLKRYGTKIEKENLDLLQFRFGQEALKTCRIMMKDISLSSFYYERMKDNLKRRLDSPSCPHPPSTLSLNPNINPRVLSKMFWPEIDEEEWLLPNAVLKAMVAFEDAYKNEAPGRYIDWQPHMGQAILEVKLGSRKRGRDDEDGGPQVVELVVSPMQATVLLEFNKKGSRTLDQLMGSTRIDEVSLLVTLNFWVARGFLRPTAPRTYIPVDAEEALGGHGPRPPYHLDLLEEMIPGGEEAEEGYEEEDEGMKERRDKMTLAASELQGLRTIEPNFLQFIGRSSHLILKSLHSFIIQHIVYKAPFLYNISEDKVQAYLNVLAREKKIRKSTQGTYHLIRHPAQGTTPHVARHH